MPSLRRTLSYPSVRSSPYQLPPSPNNGHATRAGGHFPRRVSGSDANHRRVLADIDWWTVHDGQCERDQQSADEQEQDIDGEGAAEEGTVGPNAAIASENDLSVPQATVQAPVAVAAPGGGMFDTGVLQSPIWDVSVAAPLVASPSEFPLPQFAALSLGPRTRLRRHASDASTSSLESSPESIPGDLYPIPTYMDVIGSPTTAYHPAFTPPSSLGGRPSRALPMSTRSVSYSSVEFRLSTSRFSDDRFDDVTPAPPPFFSNTMGDVDDLFY